MQLNSYIFTTTICFSALQRAEIAEIAQRRGGGDRRGLGFSALQRAEIAEMSTSDNAASPHVCFSALQRAEIAEIFARRACAVTHVRFQCSSTSRNC